MAQVWRRVDRGENIDQWFSSINQILGEDFTRNPGQKNTPAEQG